MHPDWEFFLSFFLSSLSFFLSFFEPEFFVRIKSCITLFYCIFAPQRSVFTSMGGAMALKNYIVLKKLYFCFIFK